MQLDFRTLFFVAVAASFVLGSLTLAVTEGRDDTDDMRAWGAGTLLWGLGLGLITLRDLIPPWISIDGGNTLVVVGHLVWLHGLNLFAKRRSSAWVFAVLLGVGAGSTLWFHYAVPSLPVRTAGISLVLVAIFLLGARTMVMYRSPARSVAVRITIASLLIGALLHAMRVASIANGAYHDHLMAPGNFIDGLLLVGSIITNISLVIGLMWAHEERTRAAIFHVSTHDPLTGLLNRGALDAEFERESSRAARSGTPYSLVILDIDHFKRVNDEFGHPAGDRVLRGIAGVLASVLRPHDSLARWGGEEFAVLLPDADAVGAVQVAERMRAAVDDAAFDTGRGSIRMTVSAGTATAPDGTGGMEALLAAADEALYRAKSAGRNRVISA
jgi:diguanylate cyclase (GGDEF)-like protein